MGIMKLYTQKYLTIFPLCIAHSFIFLEIFSLLLSSQPTSSCKNFFIQKYDPASCKIKTCSFSGSCRTRLHFRLFTGSTETKALRREKCGGTGSGLEKQPVPST